MASRQPISFWNKLLKQGDLFFGLGFLSIVFILVLPLPPMLLDLLLSLSVALSVLIVLTIAYLKDPTEFFVFPTVLLFVTLFRLGLNIATTRAILNEGNAGQLIETFGSFVVGGNFFIGLVIFIILTIINFVVITKGSGRVAEVSARFTLDAMPGKQMAIDADLNAGLVSEQEARARRKGLEREASFYGSMDGASKFVRGDAIAGIIITAVNLLGGFAVGVFKMGLSWEASIQKFGLLSIGDGLVTQIPALLVSVAAGILVTRSSSGSGLGEDVAKQVLSSRNTVLGTGLLMMLLALIPGFPKLALCGLGGMFVMLGYWLPTEEEVKANQIETKKASEAEAKKAASGPEKPEAVLKKQETLSLELGLGLLPLVHGNVQSMLDRLAALRKSLSVDLGIVIPPISVKDNPALPPHSYRVLLRAHEIAAGELFPGQLLAMGGGMSQRPLRGKATQEPAFGLPATWIPEMERREAERLGYTVVDPLSVLVTHVSETIKTISAELLSRQDVQRLLDSLKESDPALLQEMITLQLGLGTVHRVMQNLLQEGLPVREFAIIMEKLCDQIVFTKNPDELSEACRRALVLEISRQCELHQGKLLAITMHPEVEQFLTKGIRQSQQEIALVIDPIVARHVHDHLGIGIQNMGREGANPLLLCSPAIRLGLKRFFGETYPALKVLAYNEISPKIPLRPIYTIPALNGGGNSG